MGIYVLAKGFEAMITKMTVGILVIHFQNYEYCSF